MGTSRADRSGAGPSPPAPKAKAARPLDADGVRQLPPTGNAFQPVVLARLQRACGNAAVQRLLAARQPAPVVQREPTRPRAATGSAAIADLRGQTATPGTGKVTAGSLARQEWESLFRRHFVEPDKVEDEVESSHARYIFSRVYGWIDAQHFFAHIQFAEELGSQGATDKGLSIEQKQQRVRDLIGPDDEDPTIYSELLKANLINADDFLHYRESLFIAIALGMDMVLSGQEKALVKGFDERQLAKLILDNAMSAWSYEDLASNQLGVQFFRLHGAFVNAGADAAAVRQRFVDRLTEFFAAIEVVESPAEVRRLAAALPGKERWTSKKLPEAQARKRFPELFAFGAGTHRLRIAVYDRRAGAERGLARVRDAVPAAPGLRVEPFGTQFALVTGPMSHFEAVLLKRAVDRAAATGPGGALVTPAAAGP
ncbi:hypothetical protein AB0J86_25395 [Micromonospora sp. NPDC049559]|uniref:hypothetical protein n=1 Tax=Micromonospora sp. NPDC049559 TaxID=3155923 RepID=UPI00341CBEF1